MNKTKIDWCDASWNPVIGCRHNCPYCYARDIANRFGGFDGYGCEEDCKRVEETGVYDLTEPAYIKRGKEGKAVLAPFPFKFEPQILRYRLDEPKRMKKPHTIFVGSMCDLFGNWVPVQWIRDVFDACLAAPWHRYLFLTKNPRRYSELDRIALLPHKDNFWYGATVTKTADIERVRLWSWHNEFLSIEPLLGRVEMERGPLLPKWVIIGAETGNRKDKVTPKREWVDELAAYCNAAEIPVFYKASVRKLFPDLPASCFPQDKNDWEALQE